MMNVKPTTQHQWLRRLIGSWTFEHEIADADGKPVTVRGTETFRAIGDVWVQGEAHTAMPDGSEHVSVMTLGFDPAKGRFVGSWTGSMMANLWVYDGELDAAERVLSLYSDGPKWDGTPGLIPYMDVVTIIDDNTRTLSGNMKDADGKWQSFMTVEYKRK